jgi:hypothetical protein
MTAAEKDEWVECPMCKQDWVLWEDVLSIGRRVATCPECDATWLPGDSISGATVADYSTLLASLGAPDVPGPKGIKVVGYVLHSGGVGRWRVPKSWSNDWQRLVANGTYLGERIPNVAFLEEADLDVAVEVPAGLQRLVDQGLVDFTPWRILPRERAVSLLKALRGRYSTRFRSRNGRTTTTSRVWTPHGPVK